MWLIPWVAGGAVALWVHIVGLLYVISVISGWRRLAGRFRAEYAPEGKLYKSQSFYGRGRSRYIQTVDMYVSPTGIYMVMPARVLRWVHPPLLLPWHELHVLEESSSLVRLSVGLPEVLQIRIPRELWVARPKFS